MRGQKSLNEFINSHTLHIPVRYRGTSYEEFLTKEFIFKTTRTAMNFACDVKMLYPNFKFYLIGKEDGKIGIQFALKGSEKSKHNWLTKTIVLRDKKNASPIINEALTEFTDLESILTHDADGKYYLRFQEQENEQ